MKNSQTYSAWWLVYSEFTRALTFENVCQVAGPGLLRPSPRNPTPNPHPLLLRHRVQPPHPTCTSPKLRNCRGMNATPGEWEGGRGAGQLLEKTKEARMGGKEVRRWIMGEEVRRCIIKYCRVVLCVILEC